jgi:hypothetical protein
VTRPSTIMTIAAILAVLGASAPPALADSGQLRDPTRCGSGPANCRKLPPTARDTQRNEPRLPSSNSLRKSVDRPSRMQTSPLPSEGLQRNLDAPGSTGLDKGSTGITPPKKLPSH